MPILVARIAGRFASKYPQLPWQLTWAPGVSNFWAVVRIPPPLSHRACGIWAGVRRRGLGELSLEDNEKGPPKLYIFLSIQLFGHLPPFIFFCNWCPAVTVAHFCRLLGFARGSRKSTALGAGGTGFEFQLHTFSLCEWKRNKSLTQHSDLLRLI